MFEQINLAAARQERWDVVIAGSSFSAMFFLRGLRPDLRVLIVEKGTIRTHDDQLANGSEPEVEFSIDNQSGHKKRWVARTVFGGNSNCWWAQVPRFHPSDFSLYDDHGVGAPWPISYDDLEPFYQEVEDIMEVAGGSSGHILPRKKPFPLPPHAVSRTDARCIESRPDIWVPAPTARSNGGRLGQCCANGVCTRCPIDAKFTVLNNIDQFTRSNVRLLTGTEVRAVRTEAGVATGVSVRSADVEMEIDADLIVLGTNAIYNTTILLRTGLTSPALGRYLHEQSSQSIVLDIDAQNYFGGSSITSHCYGFYDPPDRGKVASVLIENFNAPSVIRAETHKWTNRMKIKLIAEDMPLADNRVTLDDTDQPHLIWLGHSSYSDTALNRATKELQSLFPFKIEGIYSTTKSPTEAHIQGTHRMGSSSTNSVVDQYLMTHEVPNLIALGAGSFPTCSAANPTLTLSALALRAGRNV